MKKILYLLTCFYIGSISAQEPNFDTAKLLGNTAYGDFVAIDNNTGNGNEMIFTVGSTIDSADVLVYDHETNAELFTSLGFTLTEAEITLVIKVDYNQDGIDDVFTYSAVQSRLFKGTGSLSRDASFLLVYTGPGIEFPGAAKISDTEIYLTGEAEDDEVVNYTFVIESQESAEYPDAVNCTLEAAPTGIPASRAGQHVFGYFDGNVATGLKYFGTGYLEDGTTSWIGYYQKDANGVYQLVQAPTNPVGLSYLTAADSNNDGHLDEITLMSSGSDINVLSNFSSTGFDEDLESGLPNMDHSDVKYFFQGGKRYAGISGLNHDYAGDVRYGAYQSLIYVLGDNGKWSLYHTLEYGLYFSKVYVGDVNGDGLVDIINSGLSQTRLPNYWATKTYLYLQVNPGDADTDGDGIKDSEDACPDIAGVASANGCPDADGDGIEDSKDLCPNTISTNADIDDDGIGNECDEFDNRDSDNDGVQNYLDACPNVPGTAETNGCPDTDGDGIKDSEDACPNLAGVASANGCPDADGDGIKDSEDLCPNTVSDNTDTDNDGIGNECDDRDDTDTDSDGVIDLDDACPDVAAVTINGCPVPAEPVSVSFLKPDSGGSDNGQISFTSNYNLYEYAITVLDAEEKVIAAYNTTLSNELQVNSISSGFYTVEIAISEVGFYSLVTINLESLDNIAVDFQAYAASKLSAKVSGSTNYTAKVIHVDGSSNLQNFNLASTDAYEIIIKDLSVGDKVVVSSEYSEDTFEYLVVNGVQVIAYPNPTSNYLYFTGYSGNVLVFNMFGQLVKQGQVSENTPLDMQSLGNNFYFVKVKDEIIKIKKQ